MEQGAYCRASIDSADTPESNARLGDSYLEKGLTGMARADGWFDAHWGAAVLAGCYLCRENQLDHRTVDGIKSQLDVVLERRAAQFASLPEEPADEGLIEDVPKALLPAMEGGLRAHGHAVIFAALSVKSLRDVPHMAQPALIRGLCRLSHQISRIPPREAAVPPAPYPDTQAMVDAAFDGIARFGALLGHPAVRRPNFTHMLTHTEALLTLELLGYPDVTRAGYTAQRVHIDAPVPQVDSSCETSTEHANLETVMDRAYWDDKTNQGWWQRGFSVEDNPNGDWVASGHLFKVLYSYHRLVSYVTDRKKVELCSKILLERYLNPDVQGG
ncbi:MAG: hypothetical protein HN742_15570 [Lentisphaerae bacterium]|jgi:hypothetical protein|nr:hypothetical protein [Lentisphaerota bacterium]MBT4815195.1 hypothetical protein [Lentisphaerota bacterium]MBT5607018.1 hypothetical protein [Lentisphaerota bacterium]MBT7059719.1 hypothetical protein [Lentisphaerota bacterium]MBT7843296.1 hypothetical protein [Lentisphaerota bacterium]